MTKAIPVQQNERVLVVDVIRGFALVGVLIGNFISFGYQNLPEEVFNSISSVTDNLLTSLNTIFVEWKFMTIFSILFGYGFGLIIQSLHRKQINPVPFFVRRMFYLFLIGFAHTLFWWGDVFHLYAICGVLLLIFRNAPTKYILGSALLLMFVLTPLTSIVLKDGPNYFNSENLNTLYQDYKFGNIWNVFATNLKFYVKAFLMSGNDIHDILETLGRFLLGFYFIRINLFNDIHSKIELFIKVSFLCLPFMTTYFIVTYLSLNDAIVLEVYHEALIKFGILVTSLFYVSVLVLLFLKAEKWKLFVALQLLGRMTLTNYLLISTICVVLLYGIGFGLLGILTMRSLLTFALITLIGQIFFSKIWLQKFRYGPMEWLWRSLTYQKNISIRKSAN